MNNYDFNIKAIDDAVKDMNESFMDVYFRQMGSLSYLLGQLEVLPAAEKNRYMMLAQRQSDNLNMIMGQFESLVDIMKKIDADGKKIENLSIGIAQKLSEHQANNSRSLQQSPVVKKKKVDKQENIEEKVEAHVDEKVVAEPVAQPEAPAAEVVAEPAAQPESPAVEVVAEPAAQPEAPAVEVVSEPAAQPEAPAAEVVAEPVAQPEAPTAEVVAEPAAQPEAPAAEVVSEPAAQPEAPAVEVVSEPAAQPEAPAAEVVSEPVAQPEAPAAEVVAEPVAQPEAPAAEVVAEPVAQPEAPAVEVVSEPALVLQPVDSDTVDVVEEKTIEEENKNYIADTPEQVNQEMLGVLQSIPGMENVKLGPDGRPDLSQILPKELMDKIKTKNDSSLSGIVSAVAAVEKEESGVVEPVLPVIAPEGNPEVDVTTVNEEVTDAVVVPTVAPPAAPDVPSVTENSMSLGEGIVISNPVTEDTPQQDVVAQPVIPVTTEPVEQNDSTEKVDETGLRRFVMGNAQPKAILVSEVQYNKLEGSRVTQEALLKFKHILPEINGSGPSVAIVNDVSSLSDDEKSKTIEAMMADANSLYNSGKVEEAQAMYDKISELNKTLVKN